MGETRFVTTVAEADKVNHLVVFMTGSTPFPDGLGGAGKLYNNGYIRRNRINK